MNSFRQTIAACPLEELAAMEREIIHEILRRKGIEMPEPGSNVGEAIEAARRHLYAALDLAE